MKKNCIKELVTEYEKYEETTLDFESLCQD